MERIAYMPTFLNFLPNMSPLETIINVVALLGALLLTYGVFLEAERRQDAVFIIASACLLVYSLWIGNKILSLAMAGLLIGSTIELIEILTGKHKHVCVPEYHKNSK
jgi:fumarate reductase subunit C